MAKLNLSPPWVIIYHEMEAFFEDDQDILVVFDEESTKINIYVNDAEKANALTELLPVERNCGAVTLSINVIPANSIEETALKLKARASNVPIAELYSNALAGNPHVKEIITINGIFNNPMTYVVFKKEVIQYFNDSLGDINGVCSTLCQDIANDIFAEKTGVYFCTDVE